MTERALVCAALAGLPERHLRCVTAVVSEDGRWAVALIAGDAASGLDTAADPHPLLAWLEWADGEWHQLQVTELVERGSEHDPASGRTVSWAAGRAPVQARSVRMRAGTATADGDIVDGWFLLAVWHLRSEPGRSAAAAPSVEVNFT